MDAFDQLLRTYRSIRGSSEVLPVINVDDPLEVTNLICSIALAGSFTQWGGAIGVYNAMDGFLRYLHAADSFSAASHASRESLSQAVLVCLRSVPERRVSDCVDIINNTANAIDRLNGDWSLVASMTPREVRRVLASITPEPVAQLFIAQVLGSNVRPAQSGGVSALLCRCGIVDWQDGLLGVNAIRHGARDVLAQLSPEHFLAAEWWGSGIAGCPENCAGCPAGRAGSCMSLNAGVEALM
jgi:hypothetical protein